MQVWSVCEQQRDQVLNPTVSVSKSPVLSI